MKKNQQNIFNGIISNFDNPFLQPIMIELIHLINHAGVQNGILAKKIESNTKFTNFCKDKQPKIDAFRTSTLLKDQINKTPPTQARGIDEEAMFEQLKQQFPNHIPNSNPNSNFIAFNPIAGQRCLQCGKIESGAEVFSRCSRCKRAIYCSRECQKLNWKEHKNQCTAQS